MTACIEGEGLFKQGPDAEGVDVSVAGTEEGEISGQFNATASAHQILRAGVDLNAIAGAKLFVPIGALAYDARITIQEGATIVHESASNSLGIKAKAKSAAVLISSNPPMNTAGAMTLSIPTKASKSSAALTEDEDELKEVAVFYKVIDEDSKEVRIGMIPSQDLEISDSLVKFSTNRFGIFQVAAVEQKKNKISEVKSNEKIVARKIDQVLALKLSAASIDIESTKTLRMTARADFSDGSTRIVNEIATWKSDDPTMLESKGSGDFLAAKLGTTTIRADFLGLSATHVMTVRILGLPPTISLAPLPVGITRDSTRFLISQGTRAALRFNAADSDKDPMQLECDNLPTYAAINDFSLELDPATQSTVGSTQFQCWVRTPKNMQISPIITINLEVVDVNDVPQISLSSSHTDVVIQPEGNGTVSNPIVIEVPTINYRPSSIEFDSFDAESQVVTITCTSLTAWRQLSGSVLSFSPVYVDYSPSPVSMNCRGTDSAGGDSAPIYLRIQLKLPQQHFAFLATATDGNLNGVGTADETCRTSVPSGQKFSGMNFKAVLSDHKNKLSDRIAITGPIYVAKDYNAGIATMLASGASDFYDGTLTTGLSSDLSVDDIGTTNGITVTGVVGSDLNLLKRGKNCRNWSSNSELLSVAGANFDSPTLTGADQSCDLPMNFICLSQFGPPPLKRFYSETNTAGTITLKTEFQSSVSSVGVYTEMKIYRKIGAIPPTSCDATTDGVLAKTIITGLSGTISTNDSSLPTGNNYSYRVCLKDALDRTISSHTLSDIPAKIHYYAIFVTSGYNGNLGGITAADTTCRSLASSSTSVSGMSSGSSGFRALLSTETENAFDRIYFDAPVSRPITVSAVTPIWSNYSQPMSFWELSNISAQWKNDRSGNVITGNPLNVWTGSNALGGIDAGKTCNNWMSNATGIGGTGVYNGTLGTQFSGSTSSCAATSAARFYCAGRIVP